MSTQSKLSKSVDWFSHAGALLLLAPFAGLAAFFGLLIIAMGYFLRSVEYLLKAVRVDADFASDEVVDAGVKQLPSFDRSVLRR